GVVEVGSYVSGSVATSQDHGQPDVARKEPSTRSPRRASGSDRVEPQSVGSLLDRGPGATAGQTGVVVWKSRGGHFPDGGLSEAGRRVGKVAGYYRCRLHATPRHCQGPARLGAGNRA